ncbi:MAG: DUF2029 domain-containing protein, partial [Deltaproteobacteria bacterium]|nr:DUF2029 domain-containing protein [Deltaproteobacteria bacterium]
MVTSVSSRAALWRWVASTESKTGRAFGWGLLVLGVLVCWWSSSRAGAGSDIFPIHLLARGILEGVQVYDRPVQLDAFANQYSLAPPAGVFYPPSTGFAALPLALLPPGALATAWLALMLLVLVLGVRTLTLFLRPEANWPLVAGGVLLAACTRWGVTPLQGAPLMVGLFALFYVALVRGQSGRAGALAACAVAFKFTLALPFVALLAVRRRWLALGLLGTMLITLTALGFWRLGGLAAVAAYQHNIASLEALDDINTPDPWAAFSVPRLDWIYLFYGLSRHLRLARLLAPAACGAVLLFLAWRAWRLGPALRHRELRLFLMPLVCVALLSVYHHQYDLSLALVPLIVAWIPTASKPALGLLSAPLATMMVLVPVGTLGRLLANSPLGVGLFHLAFPIAVSLALLDSVRALERGPVLEPAA